jgi:hypothetical protein
LKNYGWEINSADQSELEIEDDKLYMVSGSKYLKHEGKTKILKNSDNKLRINKAMILYGICEKGQYSKKEIKVQEYKLRRMWNYIGWVTNTPIITSHSMIDDAKLNLEMLNFCERMSMVLSSVELIRGDTIEVVQREQLELSILKQIREQRKKSKNEYEKNDIDR